MSEISKVIISLIIFILWSFGCFVSGYLLSNFRATEHLNNANRELTEQQQRYEELVRLTDERIRNIKNELFRDISDNGKAISELQELIEQIKRQRIDL